MPEVVTVSSIDTMDKLRTYIVQLFKQERYAEITQAIGMHSLLIDPQHTMNDQLNLYRHVLIMLKERISKTMGKRYGSWYVGYSKIMDQFVNEKQVITDSAAAEVLASHRAAYGPFSSVDDFFFWALDDRRLPLDQIVKYIERSTALIAC